MLNTRLAFITKTVAATAATFIFLASIAQAAILGTFEADQIVGRQFASETVLSGTFEVPAFDLGQKLARKGRTVTSIDIVFRAATSQDIRLDHFDGGTNAGSWQIGLPIELTSTELALPASPQMTLFAEESYELEPGDVVEDTLFDEQELSFTVTNNLAALLDGFTVDVFGDGFFDTIFPSRGVASTEGDFLSSIDLTVIYNEGPTPVPVPASLPLLMSGLLGLRLIGRRQSRSS